MVSTDGGSDEGAFWKPQRTLNKSSTVWELCTRVTYDIAHARCSTLIGFFLMGTTFSANKQIPCKPEN